MMESTTPCLTGTQRKYLRGLAHELKPVVRLGKNGLTESALKAIDQALGDHELIKLRLGPTSGDKEVLAREIEDALGAYHAGSVGHVGIFYRRHEDPGQRKIRLPVVAH